MLSGQFWWHRARLRANAQKGMNFFLLSSLILFVAAFDNPSVNNTSPFFSGYTAIYNQVQGSSSDQVNTADSIPLVSPNGQWKLSFSNDSVAQVTHYLEPSIWRWKAIDTATAADSYRRFVCQNDGNLVIYDSKSSVIWAKGGTLDSTSYNLTLDNDGRIIEYNQAKNIVWWKSSTITSIEAPQLTTDGGDIILLGDYYNPIQSATFRDSSISIQSATSNATVVTIPPGNGLNLSLILSDNDNTAVQIYFSYPTPTFNITVEGQFIRVDGTNAGSSAVLCLYVNSTLTVTVQLSGAQFNRTFLVPIFIPSSLMHVSLIWTGYPSFNSPSFRYTSPLDSINSTSVSNLFSTIENITSQGLAQSDTFSIQAQNISIFAAVVHQNASDFSGDIGGKNGTSFVLPSSIISSLADGRNNTRVTVILSTIPNNPFPVVDKWSTIGGLVGLSLYVNDTYANVMNATTPIRIVIPFSSEENVTADVQCLFWVQVTSSWSNEGCDTQLGYDNVTCLCNHLTNFTLGRPRIVATTQDPSGNTIVVTGDVPQAPTDSGGFNKMYLIAVAGVVPILLVGILVAVFMARRKKRETSSEFRLDVLNDVETKHEIGRGRKTVVYLGKKSGTTDVAVKKAKDKEKVKELVEEGGRLKNIHHPNILMYLGMYTEGSLTCLVINYMEQRTLRHVLSQGNKFHNDQIQNMMKQIASAMIYLHENNIVHGRLCPHKVYVSSVSSVKLSAFGAESVHDTPEYMKKYMAAEVMKNNQLTKEGDIYSYGVILDEVMSHRKMNGALLSDHGKVIVFSLLLTNKSTEKKAQSRISMRVVGTRLHNKGEEEDTSSASIIASYINRDAYGVVEI
ncbi:tyrosine-protein kinase ITK/TSK [Planoprotostelium fungivorum]|uniref:Tyrosine-protein kinase ITK/TSK n=1 Tax=Planoprotostelium fungivorum TaxID=1890364 RepID=A0A2P6NGW0_9EUKA|nr:tyrosine-protein kinase ITK/TSK [Planoprotostelium fungivorum]